jgi:LacI family repressor for deo operon, udp, cdd, tsx, nupC, and nupG
MSPPPAHRRPATIKDVARELDISVATVSRALSKPHLLRPATVERVREAVARLGYRPNLVAQNLKLGSTGIVYVVMPAMSLFFFDVFRGIERAALELGYSVVAAHTGRDPVREGEYFDQVACGRADGVLLVSSARVETRPPHQHQYPPTVAVLEADEGREFPTVRVDHVQAAASATKHLIDLGHTRIAHISGNALAPMAEHRRNGYLQAMNAAGLSTEYCVPGEFSPEAGQVAMEMLLARATPPTAVFASSDEIAVGAIRAIRAAGLSVPGDISVMGYEDQRLSRIYEPQISTVHVPTFDIGYQAMVKLRRIMAREPFDHEVVLPTHIIERATTAAPKNA